MGHSEIIGNGIVLCKNAITITESAREYIDECEQKSELPYNSQKTGVGFEFRPNDSQNGITPSRFGVNSCSHVVKEWNDAIYKSLITYCQHYPEIMPSLWWGIRGHLLSYQNNQHIGWHADNNIPNYLPANYGTIPKSQFPLHCSLSVLLYLNTSVECAKTTDEYEGGQLHFKYQNVSYAPSKGDIILYPSNFMGTHSVSRVQRGIRRAYLKFYGHGIPSSISSSEELEWLPSLRNDVNYENRFLEPKEK